MGKATLIVMAAGIGSRFGGGIKQLEPVGPNGEIIMDYSIFDAIEAGFDKVVFVIRKDLEKDFKEIIGRRIEKQINIEYAYQEVSDIPEQYLEKFKDRKKPWGTGHAVLCCKDIIKEPFLVINADDYYGKEAYREAFKFLTGHIDEGKKLTSCMVGFILKNTLSANGGVTRGVCRVNNDRMLTDIVETHNIVKVNDKAEVREGNSVESIDINSEVSMNMWGFTNEFFGVLKSGFLEFLESADKGEEKKEYLLPTIVGGLLKENKIEVKVLQSMDKWFGVTYKMDKVEVLKSIKDLIKEGIYEEKLFK